MDVRRTILWVIFSISLLLLWGNWKETQKLADVQTAQKAAAPSETNPSSTVPTSNPVPAVSNVAQPVQSAGLVSMQTDVLHLQIDRLGGQIVFAELLKHVDSNDMKTPVQLLHNTNTQSQYIVQSGLIANNNLNMPNHETVYTLKAGDCNPCRLDSKEANSGVTKLVLVAQTPDALVEKTFTLRDGSYNVEVSYAITNLTSAEMTPSVYYQIARDGSTPPGESFFYSTFTGPTIFSDEGKYQKLHFSDIDKNQAEFIKDTQTGWIGMVQHYFAVAWVPPQNIKRTNSVVVNDSHIYRVFTVLNNIAKIAPQATHNITAQLWIGPQDQGALEKLDANLPLVVDYGWLTFIAKYLFQLMVLINSFVPNWGWTIVILTLVLKLLFFPLSAASYRSMAKMKKLAPRLATLKERYGDDKMKLNQEMMAMYKTEKINPLGGCLPMLLQIPVFISLYWVILASVEIRNAPWILWVHDLSSPDPFFILPAIMMGTMFLQMRLNPKPTDPTQAKVMMMMPIMFGGMMFFFPAGLVLYWVVNNILSIAQQWYITKQIEAKDQASA